MDWKNILKRDRTWTPHKKEAPRPLSRPAIDTRTAEQRRAQYSKETGGEKGKKDRKKTRENKEAVLKELEALESLVEEAQFREQRKEEAGYYVDTQLSKRNRDKFPMLRKSILKFFGPRQFLEHFREKLGGEIYSSHATGGRRSRMPKGNPELKLDYGKDFLKVKSYGGQYHISKRNAVIASSPSLKELVPIIERNLRL